MATNDIEADALETIYKDSTYTTGYYFVRFKNSIDSTFSGYSDPIPVGGYADNTVFKIKERALEELGLDISENLTHDWLNRRLWAGRRIVHQKRKRWSWRQQFDYDLGNIATGDYRVAMPTDIADDNTNRDVMGFRISVNENMTPVTKREMDDEWEGTARTTLASAYTVGDGTITLDDSRDLEDSGSIEIDEDTIEYSANNRSTGVLTVSTDGSSNHSANVNVYQNVSFTLPTKFTIYEGYVYFNYPIASDYNGMNYWMDYYRTLTAYDSDADVLDEPEYDFYTSWLKYCIKKKQDPKNVKMKTDDDYQAFLVGISDLIMKETTGQEIQFIPDISHLDED